MRVASDNEVRSLCVDSGDGVESITSVRDTLENGLFWNSFVVLVREICACFEVGVEMVVCNLRALKGDALVLRFNVVDLALGDACLMELDGFLRDERWSIVLWCVMTKDC